MAINLSLDDDSSIGSDDVQIIEDDSFIIDLEVVERAAAEQKYRILLDMFPDADLTYLEAKSAEYALDNPNFDLFVSDVMLAQQYPKKQVIDVEAQEVPNLISIEDLNQNFDLQEFLKKYPDPFKHFSESGRGAHYIPYSCNYLYSSYPLVSAARIKNLLKENKYSLYLTYLAVNKEKPSRKIPRRPYEIQSPIGRPPEEFLEELSFIFHEAEIKQYLIDKAVARDSAVQEARRANALLTCGCCFSDDLLTEEVMNCSEGHIFCKDCIRRSSEVLIGDGKIDFPCLQECPGSFVVDILKGIISDNTYEKLLKKITEREVISANIPGLHSCPFCEYCAIPPEGSNIFDCDMCKNQSCRLCRKKSHIPLKCNEVQDEATKERVLIEEKMTEALLRKCYRCGAKFIREDGCNKMQCPCGAKMCYICRKPVKGYDHFDQNSHSIQAPTSSGKCPLWTNNNKLHKFEVAREAKKAMEELKRRNPEVELMLFKKKK